jgi:hypothetical protein
MADVPKDHEAQTCNSCGVVFSAPRYFFDARRMDKRLFYCPNGHGLSWQESDFDRMRRERDRLKQENARLEDHRRAAERAEQAALEHANYERRRVAAAKGQITRLKNRAAAGVCPCCSRTFVNLQRHMATKHAKFLAEEVLPEGVSVQ